MLEFTCRYITIGESLDEGETDGIVGTICFAAAFFGKCCGCGLLDGDKYIYFIDHYLKN